MRKLFDLLYKHENVMLYAVFGILTTVVNYCIYFPLFYTAGFTAVLSNVIAWFAAVLFSFFTNKAFVFSSNNWSLKNVVIEIAEFFGCRILTGALETALLYIFVDELAFESIICKLIISLLVVCLNYITSRLLVFRRK